MTIRATLLAAGAGLWAGALCAGAPLGAQQINARGGSTVTLGARVQVQYEASSAQDSISSFSIRRAWVTIDGKLSDKVGGRVQFNANGASVFEAYLQLKPSDAFQVQIGQFQAGHVPTSGWRAKRGFFRSSKRDGTGDGGESTVPGVGGRLLLRAADRRAGSGRLRTGNPHGPGAFGGGTHGVSVSPWTNGEGRGKDVNTSKSASGRLSAFFGERGRASGPTWLSTRTPRLRRRDDGSARLRGGAGESGHGATGPPPAGQRPNRPQLEGRRRTRTFLRVPGDGVSGTGPLDPESGKSRRSSPLLRVSWASNRFPGRRPTSWGTVAGDRPSPPDSWCTSRAGNGISANLGPL